MMLGPVASTMATSGASHPTAPPRAGHDNRPGDSRRRGPGGCGTPGGAGSWDAGYGLGEAGWGRWEAMGEEGGGMQRWDAEVGCRGGMPWGGVPTPKAQQDPRWGHAVGVPPLLTHLRCTSGQTPPRGSLRTPPGGGAWAAPLGRGVMTAGPPSVFKPPSLSRHPLALPAAASGGLNPQTRERRSSPSRRVTPKAPVGVGRRGSPAHPPAPLVLRGRKQPPTPPTLILGDVRRGHRAARGDTAPTPALRGSASPATPCPAPGPSVTAAKVQPKAKLRA